MENMERQLNVRLTPKLLLALKKEAAKRHCSQSDIVRQALLQELARGGMSKIVDEAVREVMEDAVGRVAARLKRAG